MENSVILMMSILNSPGLYKIFNNLTEGLEDLTKFGLLLLNNGKQSVDSEEDIAFILRFYEKSEYLKCIMITEKECLVFNKSWVLSRLRAYLETLL